MVFTQLIQFASDDVFKGCVKRYNGDYNNKGLTCWKQFLCMAFGQLTVRQDGNYNDLFVQSIRNSNLFL
jgi:hypothetical protein